ncbi:PQQ-binding-like beta-propeller repeat protein [Verrucomicrobiota bacterium sgz303538]
MAFSAFAADWPQWRGPQRDDVSRETGLLKQWPAEGPKRVWLFEKAGAGYAGFSIADGQLFTMGTRDGKEVLLALDANTGKELWSAPIGDVLGNNWGDGPRGTPTVDGDRVYALGGQGTLICADRKGGQVVWKHTMQELGGKTPGWGYTESVLVDGNQVVCTPGGKQGTLAAFDKNTGAKLWQSTEWTDGAQYSSIVPAKINGQQQYVQLVMEAFAGVDPKDGKVLWRVPFPGRTAVIPTPIVRDNNVFVTAGYGVGSKMVEIQPGNQVKEIYENKIMKNHHGGVVLVGDHLYGHSDGVGWLCMDFKTGNQVWAERNALGKGAVSAADGMLYCLDEGKGTVVLAEAAPTGWKEHGRFTLEPQSKTRSPQGRIWTHPVISNGKLYLRDQEYIYCFDVKS